MKRELFIVHPCYNPKKHWEKKLANQHSRLLSVLPGDISVSLMLVNDGSDTGISMEHICFLQSRIPNFHYIKHSQNSGKGFALRSAIKNIQADFFICTDIDYPYRIENSAEIFRLLNENRCDVVTGSRKMNYYKKLPPGRIFFSLAFRLANHLFFPRLFTKDTQSGLKGFNCEGKKVFLETKINEFLFDTEFILLCAEEKLRMQKIHLELNDNIAFEPVKWQVVKTEIQNFVKLLKK